jgi:hypothetical protein
MSSAAHEEKKTGGNVVQELKSVSHDVFNLMTVMYGLQETFQAIPAESDAYARALADFNQIVAKMQQIGDRLLRIYREEGGATAKS